jgi:hypothetical protein
MKSSWKFFSDSLINDIHSVPLLQNIAKTLNADDGWMMMDDDDTISHYVLLSVSKIVIRNHPLQPHSNIIDLDVEKRMMI